MAEIRWTQEAAAWLEDIYRYIAQDNPQAAQRAVNAIHEKVQLLKTFPLLGHRHRSEPEGEIRSQLKCSVSFTQLWISTAT
jgi:plasmid stabilization system protein ParE